MTQRAPPKENQTPPDERLCDSSMKRVPEVPRNFMKLSGRTENNSNDMPPAKIFLP
jgi:hypothetical protein